METARGDDARDFLRAECPKPCMPLPCRQILEVGLFRRTENLDALFSEIGVETGKREAGAVNRRFPKAPFEADLLALQLELKRLGVPLEESLDRDDRDVHALLASRPNGLNNWLGAHVHARCIPNWR